MKAAGDAPTGRTARRSQCGPAGVFTTYLTAPGLVAAAEGALLPLRNPAKGRSVHLTGCLSLRIHTPGPGNSCVVLCSARCSLPLSRANARQVRLPPKLPDPAWRVALALPRYAMRTAFCSRSFACLSVFSAPQATSGSGRGVSRGARQAGRTPVTSPAPFAFARGIASSNTRTCSMSRF